MGYKVHTTPPLFKKDFSLAFGKNLLSKVKNYDP